VNRGQGGGESRDEENKGGGGEHFLIFCECGCFTLTCRGYQMIYSRRRELFLYSPEARSVIGSTTSSCTSCLRITMPATSIVEPLKSLQRTGIR
jgi:hypothetical protein